MDSKKTKEMIIRIITGLILLPLSIFLIVKAHSHVFFLVIYIIQLLAVKEFINIAKNNNVYVSKFMIWASAVIMPFLMFFFSDFTPFILASFILLFVLFLLKMFSANPTEKVIEEVSYNFFVALYLPFLFTFLSLLKNIGYEWVLFLCFVIWASDSFAYFTGVALGKHKLIPKVSPGKSIEGLIGGAVGAFVVRPALADLQSAGTWVILTQDCKSVRVGKSPEMDSENVCAPCLLNMLSDSHLHSSIAPRSASEG